MNLYDRGAAALWSGNQVVLGGTGEKAGWQARQITENLIALKNQVNANSSKFPAAYTDALQQFINSWQSFLVFVSGKNIPWYDFANQVNRTLYTKFNGAEIYNQVQKYGAQYQQLWDLASAKLGQPATPTRPPAVNQPASETPVADLVGMVVKGGLLLTGAYLGARLLLDWTKTKHRTAPAAAPVEE